MACCCAPVARSPLELALERTRRCELTTININSARTRTGAGRRGRARADVLCPRVIGDAGSGIGEAGATAIAEALMANTSVTTVHMGGEHARARVGAGAPSVWQRGEPRMRVGCASRAPRARVSDNGVGDGARGGAQVEHEREDHQHA